VTHVQTLPDAQALASHAASEIARLLEEAREQRGVAHVALSGGGTPKHTYELLAQTLESWEDVEVWFADERCVAPDDEESNYRLAAETLLRPAGIADERVHRMLGELGPQDGASRYAQELRLLEGTPIDVAVLGIGPEGHIASLFPHHPALQATDPCVGVPDSPKPPPQRITLTLPVLRAVRHCLVIASGQEKAGAISGMLGEPTEDVPASLLPRERLTVMVDDDASGAPGAPWLTHGPR
jgi:6-phosphogluconolactonase